jgi:hypothetical protein
MPSDILSEVSLICTLEEALRWALKRRPPAALFNVVTQDEFTHDIVVRAAEGCFLVFDTN